MANNNFQRVVDIMRRVIARRNSTDTLSTDNELIEYIGSYMRDEMPEEIKNFENFDTYDFNTVNATEQYTYNINNAAQPGLGDGSDIDGDVFENIGPVAYSDEQLMNWFQDPDLFHDKWGFDTGIAAANIQTGQPTDILFHNDRFILKPRPDAAYRIRIFGFKRNQDFTDVGTAQLLQASSDNAVPENYWLRMVAYGAALDYMYDFGYDVNRISSVENRYKHYKGLVHGRTFNQFKQNTPVPRW